MMKRHLSLAVLATLASGAALAQSSVTLYGRVNTSLERQKVDNVTSSSMVNNSSRWGLKGSEDLGGGLKASFLLESGFASDTGAGAGGFGRESWVGLESASLGKLRLGNVSSTALYFATADYISLHNHDTGSSADAFYLYQGTSTDTVAYTSPNLGGLVGEAQVGMDDGAGRRTYVLAANYDAGPLHLGGGFLDGTDNSGIGGDRAKQFGVRALYEFGPMVFGAYYINDKVQNVPLVGDVKRNSFRLAAQYNLGAGEVHANVGIAGKLKAAGNTLDGTGATQFTLGYNHNLSKRTKLYTFYTRITNKENVAYTLGGGQSGVDGSDPSSLAVGIRHNF